ncbi:hypothetical protein I4U23_000050 [Adineta vaga]|nr:hypothetical protein I4U23_000050 [Adineta vaga]
MTTDFTEIPVINFDRFLHGTKEEKLKVAKEIGEVCRNVGFFYLKNHDVPQQLTKDAFAQAKRYFALPLDVKMKHAMGPPPDGESRGFSPFLTEKFAAKGDYKETFHFALELSKDDPDVQKGAVLYGPNQWPDLPGFREVIYDGYYLAVKELANKLCVAFALALDLPEDYFVSLTDKPMANMSVMWYPPQSRDEPIDPHLLGEYLFPFIILSQI